jgi:hypothetical protein
MLNKSYKNLERSGNFYRKNLYKECVVQICKRTKDKNSTLFKL